MGFPIESTIATLLLLKGSDKSRTGSDRLQLKELKTTSEIYGIINMKVI